MKINIRDVFKNKTLVNGSLFALFSFFNKGMAFLLVIIIANFIEPAAYGQLSLFTTIVTLLGFFIALSSEGYIEVSYFQKEKEKFASDLTSILIIAVINSCIICAITYLFKEKISQWTQLPIAFLYYAILIAFFTITFNILLSIARVKEKVLVYGALSCGNAIIGFVVTLVLVVGLRMGWEGRVYTFTITAIFFGLLALGCFGARHYYTININKSDFYNVLKWGVPLIPHLGATWIKQGGDRLIVNGFYSLDEVGIFSFALNLLSIISMLGLAFNSTNSVSIYQILSSDKTSLEKRANLKSQTKQIRTIYIIGTIAVIIGVVIVIPIAVPNYATAIPYFLILSVSGFFHCLYLLYCNYLFYYGCNSKIMNVTFITALLHLLLSFLLTRYSLYLTCVVYCISSIIIFIMIRSRSMKVLNERL